MIALWVDDARQAWRETTSRGAVSVAEPYVLADEHGRVVLSSIRTYGDTIHTFVERDNYAGPFLPGLSCDVESDHDRAARPACSTSITWSAMSAGTRWTSGSTSTRNVMGFSLYQHFDDKDISTEYSALMSKVMANGNGYVKFPINEPAEGKRKSQIEEYLDFYRGPGVQHIALATNDILHTVKQAARAGRRVPARSAHLLHRIAEARRHDR